MIVSAAVFGAAAGSALGGALGDFAGRKKTLLVGDALFAVGRPPHGSRSGCGAPHRRSALPSGTLAPLSLRGVALPACIKARGVPSVTMTTSRWHKYRHLAMTTSCAVSNAGDSNFLARVPQPMAFTHTVPV